MPGSPYSRKVKGHTGVPLVPSVTSPQKQTFDRLATSNAAPTPFFAKSWLPGTGGGHPIYGATSAKWYMILVSSLNYSHLNSHRI